MTEYFVGLTSLVYAAFLLWLWRGVNRLAPCAPDQVAPISIIVTMRDEQKNAAACVRALLNQDYPSDRLDIVIVDDASQDATPSILAGFKQSQPRMKVIRQEADIPGDSRKKQALHRAIAHCRGEILLFTDADCLPPPTWARSLVACFDARTGLVAGYSPIIDPTHSWAGSILTIDSLAAAVVAAGSIKNGSAVTCTGRNLAYRRAAYDEVDGFEAINRSVSGDDDLFLQLVHRKTDWKINFASGAGAIVPSVQSKSLSGIFVQKRRHLSAGKFYATKVQLGYFIYHFVNIGLHLILPLTLLPGWNSALPFGALAAKYAADYFILRTARNRLQADVSLKQFVPWELFFVLYNALIGPVSWIGKIRWK
ncbi:MAG: glycosyltransferase [Candidatus Zhuqueibacterota bacterium]